MNNILSIINKLDSIEYLVFIFLIILVFLLACKYKERVEPFTNKQTKKYTLKENDELYDDFYSDIYDQLVLDELRNFHELNIVEKNAALTKDSVVLDIGCGTGHHCKLFNEYGCDCVGIDKSEHMIKQAKINAPNTKFITNDVLDVSNFNTHQFTHITIFYFSIYYIKDKAALFRNALDWLQPNGYLILHLVNKYKFDPILPSADVLVVGNPQNHTKKRITNSILVFDKFKYRANFKLNKNKAIFDEKFIYKNNKVRHHQHTLWMEEQKDILNTAKSCGFIVEKQFHLKDYDYDYQYIYILKKPF